MHKCHFCQEPFPCPNEGENCGGKDYQICASCFLEDGLIEGLLTTLSGQGDRNELRIPQIQD